jgi:hypothetical protein
MKMKSGKDESQKYRELTDGEAVRPGDQFYFDRMEWRDLASDHLGKRVDRGWLPVRRPLYELDGVDPKHQEFVGVLKQFLGKNDPWELYSIFSKMLEEHGVEFEMHRLTASFGYLYVPSTRKNGVVLVAHMDTVWDGDFDPRTIDIDVVGSIVYNSLITARSPHSLERDSSPLTGIGADDRLGVATLYAMVQMKIIQETGHGLLITCGEEIVLGSYIISRHQPLIDALEKDQVKLFIELDYPGVACFTNYGMESKKFLKSVEELTGFGRVNGSFSDIAALGESTGIPGINWAIGYYRPHKSREYIDLEHWQYNVHHLAKFIQDKYLKADYD